VREDIDQFNDANVQPFGVNPAGVESHARYAAKLAFPFPLLSDAGGEVADAFGALKSDRRKIHRSVVLIGQDGRVRFAGRGAPPAGTVLPALAED
jgi:peroxiredoxin